MDNTSIIAYLAGIVDGEGSFVVTRIKSGRYYKYGIRLQLPNTDGLITDMLIEYFGGNYIIRKHEEHRKQQYLWYVDGHKAYTTCKTLYSYLVLKREEAEVCINMYEKVIKWNFYVRPLWAIKYQEECYDRMKLLKQRNRLPTIKISEKLEEYNMRQKVNVNNARNKVLFDA